MIIGTAGHIDHGKSTLVTALTGRPMDRLAEERRRGITIELNFAPLRLEGVPPLGIVDVPGHEDFVRTMVAGATGIDLVLLVVDAVEGIRPQTLEHLAIVEQLGISRGIPVVTKIDLADAEWVELVVADLAERLARSPVAFSHPVRVSPVTGAGMDDLRAALAAEAARTTAGPEADDLVRLPIDRAFPVAGTGPVVTGTLWSGRLAVGGQVLIEPGGLSARVRSLECFGESLREAVPGARTAVGLTGVSVGDLRRGQVVLDAADWKAVTRFDAFVSLLDTAPRPLMTRTRVRVHHGTAEVIGRVYPRRAISPGESGPSRITLELPIVVRGGDRFVLRSYSPVATIGGGWVADPDPPPKAAWPPDLTAVEPAERLAALVERRPHGVSAELIPRLLGTRIEGEVEGLVLVAGRVIPQAATEKARLRILDRLRAFHQREPSAPGESIETVRSGLGRLSWLAETLFDQLEAQGNIRRRDGTVALADHRPVSKGGEGEVEQLVEAIRSAGLEAPLVTELAARHPYRDLPGAIRLAASRGQIQAVERDRYASIEALGRFEEALRDVGKGNAEISPAALRDRLGLSRKHLIPLLEHADRKGITWRDSQGVRRLKN